MQTSYLLFINSFGTVQTGLVLNEIRLLWIDWSVFIIKGL